VKYWGWLILIAGFLGSCTNNPSTNSGDEILVCTTGMVGDLVQNLAPEGVKVRVIMGPGVDPHLYKPAPSDLGLLRHSKAIFLNGLHLEGKMTEIFTGLARSKPVFAIGDSVPVNQLRQTGSAYYDPHIWFDVSIWLKAGSAAKVGLIQLYPDKKEEISNKAEKYFAELSALDSFIKKEIGTIPSGRKILVTSHDAFGYFGRAYGMQVEALQGISTVADFGIAEVNNLVNLIIEKKIPAVFIETSVSPKAIEAVMAGCDSKGFKVKKGGSLFSDALGDPGNASGTYIGMVKTNVSTIVKALR